MTRRGKKDDAAEAGPLLRVSPAGSEKLSEASAAADPR